MYDQRPNTHQSHARKDDGFHGDRPRSPIPYPHDSTKYLYLHWCQDEEDAPDDSTQSLPQ